MSIRAKCHGCQRNVSAHDSYAGKQAKCPGCGGTIHFPVLPSQVLPDFQATIPTAASHSAPDVVQKRVPCPFCAELILIDAQKCRYCGEYLEIALQSVVHAEPEANRQSLVSSTDNSNTKSSLPNLKTSFKVLSRIWALPLWRIGATSVLAALYTWMNLEVSGYPKGLIISCAVMAIIAPLIFLFNRLCLLAPRTLWTMWSSPVHWGVLMLIPTLFKFFAPFSFLFFVPWATHQSDSESSAYKWTIRKQWGFFVFSFLCLVGAIALRNEFGSSEGKPFFWDRIREDVAELKNDAPGSTSKIVEPVRTDPKQRIDWDDIGTVLDIEETVNEPLPPSEVYERAVSSVVLIRSYRDGDELSLGSGFMFSGIPNALPRIVTNEHVIRGASNLIITDRNGVTATIDNVVGVSRTSDIALLPIPLAIIAGNLTQPPTNPHVGEDVFALGSPMGLDFTFTSGSISQFREIDGVPMIQTDTNLSGGSSGGPLLNDRAKVIGVNTLASRSEIGANNLNFAISITEVIRLCSEFEKTPLSKLRDLDGYKKWGEQQVAVKRAAQEEQKINAYKAEMQRLKNERDRITKRRESEKRLKEWDRSLDAVIMANRAEILKASNSWKRLRLGMTLAEVETLLGQPSSTRLFDALGRLHLTYRYDFGSGQEGTIVIQEYEGVTSWNVPLFPSAE